MYAVIRTGGKQHRVEPGRSVRVDRLAGAVGDSVELNEVLLVGGEGEARVGQPLVAGVVAVATITAQGRGPKLRVFKMKRRKNYRRRSGHRQDFTELRVEKIEG
jgi:large subunit ribosomal protein L21